MCSLPVSQDPCFINREEKNADAGIYRVSEDIALVQSVDFFTPVVDDPYVFGEIAAANAFSDIYAVGGTPLTVLNLVCFPCKSLGHDTLKEILAGGHAKTEEAGAAVVGGHSVEDEEPKYGLSVTGKVHPAEIVSHAAARPKDLLVLTKPLGAGVITTALKGQAVSANEARQALDGMTALNRDASLAMKEVGVNACTDITGFGLLGHAVEMAADSKVCLRLNLHALPFYEGAWELADMGIIPGGAYHNKEYYGRVMKINVDEKEKETELNLASDPQTSGGLLMSVPPHKSEDLTAALNRYGIKGYIIGEVTAPLEGPQDLQVVVEE